MIREHGRTSGTLRITTVWFITVALSTTTWLEANHGAGRAASMAVMALTLLKATLVISDYMEVRQAPWWLVGACGAWLAVVGTTLLVLAGWH